MDARRATAALVTVLVAPLSGCGSDPDRFPPPSEPARSPVPTTAPEGRVAAAGRLPHGLRWPDGAARLDDGRTARIDRRRRRLILSDPTGRTVADVPAGIGPATVAAGAGGRLYVADTGGGSILYFRTQPDVALVRRAALPGRPYATAVDRKRGKLWVTVTATNEAVQMAADGAPRVQRRVRTVRQPNAIAVDEARGTVYVAGAGRRLQAFPASKPR